MLGNSVSDTGSVSVFRWGEGDTLLGPLERANLNDWSTHQVNLRPTVSRPVYLAYDKIFFLPDICEFLDVERPLWREDGSVIYCTIASGPRQSSHSWVEVPQNSTIIFYCLIWDSPNLEGQVPVFISPRNRVAQLYPQALGSLFIVSYVSGLRWRYSNPPPHGKPLDNPCQVKVQVTLRPTVSRPVRLGVRPIWDPRPIFLPPWDFLLDSYCLLCCSALSDERTGLFFTVAAGPRQRQSQITYQQLHKHLSPG
jgi:hypothetical protein